MATVATAMPSKHSESGHWLPSPLLIEKRYYRTTIITIVDKKSDPQRRPDYHLPYRSHRVKYLIGPLPC